jgi:predicted nucleotidyltransferase
LEENKILRIKLLRLIENEEFFKIELMRKKLKKIEKQIIEALKPYNPEKILLFGSRAGKKFKRDSDFDLLLVKETKKSPSERIPEARLHLLKINFPFDVLVMTPREIKKRLKMGDFFIEEILKKGKVLYETKK